MRSLGKCEGRSVWGWGGLVFICFLAVYAWTAQRGVSWQDSGEYQSRILAGDYQWHSGIARAHRFVSAIRELSFGRDAVSGGGIPR